MKVAGRGVGEQPPHRLGLDGDVGTDAAGETFDKGDKVGPVAQRGQVNAEAFQPEAQGGQQVACGGGCSKGFGGRRQHQHIGAQHG